MDMKLPLVSPTNSDQDVVFVSNLVIGPGVVLEVQRTAPAKAGRVVQVCIHGCIVDGRPSQHSDAPLITLVDADDRMVLVIKDAIITRQGPDLASPIPAEVPVVEWTSLPPEPPEPKE